MVERQPALFDIDRECALAAIIDLEPGWQELIQGVFEGFFEWPWNTGPLNPYALAVPELHAVDGPGVTSARIGSLNVGDLKGPKRRQNLSSEPVL